MWNLFLRSANKNKLDSQNFLVILGLWIKNSIISDFYVDSFRNLLPKQKSIYNDILRVNLIGNIFTFLCQNDEFDIKYI